MAQTPNRSAGRLDDDTWARFRAWAKWQELSNSDAMRRLIWDHCEVPADGSSPPPAGRHRATMETPALGPES